MRILASKTGASEESRTLDRRFTKACLIVIIGGFTVKSNLLGLLRKTSFWRRVRSGKNAFGLV